MVYKRCPICQQHARTLRTRFRLPEEIKARDKVSKDYPRWDPDSGACERCLFLYHHELFRKHLKNNLALLPTPLRIDADPRFTGRGVSIAFLDSGFFPHPDLVKPRNRILSIQDATPDAFGAAYFRRPHPESWHGTMSAVLASGNGHSSRGFYPGAASDARLVCIKVMNTWRRHISAENIANGLGRAIAMQDRFGIRIINISVGADKPELLADSRVDQLVEKASSLGIVVIVAAGNSPGNAIVPPASAPSAITVGGYDDHNSLDVGLRSYYHSSYGITLDGYLKPDLLGLGQNVAGPILPRTGQFKESQLLFRILQAKEKTAWRIFVEKRNDLGGRTARVTERSLKKWALRRVKTMKYVGPRLKRMDGSSVAAAIVTSIAAQLLEADPTLSPERVKAVLQESGLLISGIPKERQGRGVVDARKAVANIHKNRHSSHKTGIFLQNGCVFAFFEYPNAGEVSLAGDFNDWDPEATPLKEIRRGEWAGVFEKPATDLLRYKLVIDGTEWIPDPNNQTREPDGFGGWNSMLDFGENGEKGRATVSRG